MSILDLITDESGYQYRKETANEYGGPCPFCKTGVDRFNIWPEKGRYWCRKCGKSGDAIEFVREYRGMSFHEAVEFLNQQGFPVRPNTPPPSISDDSNMTTSISLQGVSPPSDKWRERGLDFVIDCQKRLMESDENPRARQWLNEERGLTDETLWQYGIGYWPTDSYDDQHKWGLDDREKRVWLPRSITIPWMLNGHLWGIRERRPVGDPKYYWIPGGTGSALYGADLLHADRPAVMVEGEFDALIIRQNASDLISVVASGSTTGARRIKWLARLALAPIVLVAFDTDSAGEEASRYWLDAVEYAYRWRPDRDDPNGLAKDGADIRSWIQQGLAYFARAFRDSDA